MEDGLDETLTYTRGLPQKGSSYFWQAVPGCCARWKRLTMRLIPLW